MRNKLTKGLSGSLIVLVVTALLGSGYYLGFSQGEKQSQTVVVEGIQNTSSSLAGMADFGTFWDTWQLISQNYLNNSSTSNQNKVYGAVRGLVSSLNDPYSEFFDPTENKQFQEDVQGNFSGIGAEIGMRKDVLTIVAPLKGSPAERAGLKAGDMVLAINSSSTDGIAVDEAVRRIRGPEGSVVTLTVFREGWDKPRDIPIKRENIEVPTLTYEMKNGNIAYISLTHFNANAPQLFANAAQTALQNGAKGMVLDLRNDPGGYLEVAVQLAGWFIPNGQMVVSQESRTGPNDELKSTGNAALKNMPLVVLINGGSASASEILAGSLRDYKIATLVGEQSFGKGVVQQVFPLKDDASVKLTVAHWVMPGGQVLEGTGIKPDIEVKISDADAAAGKDPQLDKALEVVKSKIK
ncbi:MAG: S41 family peptidase [Candidatus Liptonbacteria bacterium]